MKHYAIRFGAWSQFYTLACLVSMLAGCGGSSKDADPNLRSVTGTVSAGGKALEGGTITFVSSDGKSSYSGVISPSGKYEIKASGSATGAPPGEYKVGVESWKSIPTMENPEGELAIDKKFTDPTTSGVSVTVGSDGGVHDIDLK